MWIFHANCTNGINVSHRFCDKALETKNPVFISCQGGMDLLDVRFVCLNILEGYFVLALEMNLNTRKFTAGGCKKMTEQNVEINEWEEANRSGCEEASLLDMCSWGEAN